MRKFGSVLLLSSSIFLGLAGCGGGENGSSTVTIQALATAGSEGASQPERTPMDLSAATATRTNCETIVGQPLYAGQNTWVAQTHWQCANAVP